MTSGVCLAQWGQWRGLLVPDAAAIIALQVTNARGDLNRDAAGYDIGEQEGDSAAPLYCLSTLAAIDVGDCAVRASDLHRRSGPEGDHRMTAGRLTTLLRAL